MKKKKTVRVEHAMRVLNKHDLQAIGILFMWLASALIMVAIIASIPAWWPW